MRRLSRRVLSVATTAAMVFALAPAAAAMADTANACAAAPPAPEFEDVQPNGVFEQFIECVVGHGLVDGFGDGTFGPAESVTRGQAAKFVARFVEVAQGTALPLPEQNPYTDVEEDGTFGPFILKLTEAGIVEGVTADTYEPAGTLTRGQMSKIVALGLEHLGITLDDSSAGYPDVTAGGVFAQYINQLTNANVVEGFDDGTFRPGANVSRGQLAKFVANGSGVADDNDQFDPTRLIGPVLRSDVGTATAGETITVTVTAYDENGAPVEGTTIDAFVVDGDRHFNDDGSENFAEGATVDGSGNQTGAFPAAIDPGDPSTDANGELTLEIDSAAAQKVAVIAWTGSLGATFDNSVDRDARTSITLRFTAGPAEVGLSADRETNTYPYGDDPTITAQLLDAEGEPVTTEGETIQWQVTTGGNPPLQPGDTVAEGSATTDAAGEATFTFAGAEDPDADGDNSTNYNITAFVDSDGDGTQGENETAEGSLAITFDDESADTIGSAVLAHNSSNNPYDQTIDANVVATSHTVTVTVQNIYGDPIAGTDVDFTFSIQTAADTTKQTDANGVASVTYSGPNADAKGSETISATVGPDNQETEPAELTKAWVEVADDATQDTGNAGFGESILGLNTGADRVDVGGVFFRYSWDSTDTFQVNGSEVSQAEFEAAIEEAASQDRLAVDFEPGGDSTFNFLNSPA